MMSSEAQNSCLYLPATQWDRWTDHGSPLQRPVQLIQRVILRLCFILYKAIYPSFRADNYLSSSILCGSNWNAKRMLVANLYNNKCHLIKFLPMPFAMRMPASVFRLVFSERNQRQIAKACRRWCGQLMWIFNPLIRAELWALYRGSAMSTGARAKSALGFPRARCPIQTWIWRALVNHSLFS